MASPRAAHHWVFDLDGTLVDSFAAYFDSLVGIFGAFGREFTKDLHHAALTEPLPRFFERHLGADAVPAAFEELQIRSNADAERIRPFDGIPELLRALRERGDRVAVWTNRDLVSADLILRHSGLEPLVERLVTGTCVPQKPHPEGLQRLMAHFGCTAETVTMIGDHEYDVAAAKSQGTRAVRASWHAYWQVDPCRVADHHFHELPEFARWASGSEENALNAPRVF